MVVSKVIVGPADQITVDVIVTGDASPFPDYEIDTVFGDFATAEGSLGALAVRDYTVTSSLRQYDVTTQSTCAGLPSDANK
jgi:hypothetical protein